MPAVERLVRRDLFGETWETVSTWETMEEAEADLWYRRDRGETVRSDF